MRPKKRKKKDSLHLLLMHSQSEQKASMLSQYPLNKMPPNKKMQINFIDIKEQFFDHSGELKGKEKKR